MSGQPGEECPHRDHNCSDKKQRRRDANGEADIAIDENASRWEWFFDGSTGMFESIDARERLDPSFVELFKDFRGALLPW